MAENNFLVLSTIGVNSALGLIDRIVQIICYCKNKNEFSNKTIKHTSLTFCILPSCLHLLMILCFTLFHHETLLTLKLKLKNFFLYVISQEALYPIGCHRAMRTKYSDNADNVIVTMKVINAIHVMFVSIPQLLIICIHGSAIDKFKGYNIAGLFFSILFIIWSVIYYFICVKYDDDYDSIISKYSKEPIFDLKTE
jgi:hypothetical protein